MINSKEKLSSNQLIDNILVPCAKAYCKSCKSNESVTLKVIYSLNFWLILTPQERRRFGYRFRCICQTLGFKYTGIKQNKSNLYVLIN